MTADVACVIPTRGDVDMTEVIAPYHELAIPVVIWDNRLNDDLSVYGRYAGIASTDRPVIVVQDDDCVLPAESIGALLEAYQPGHVVCNMPERFRPHYPDSALVGFGAVFDRDLPAQAFERAGFATKVERGCCEVFADPDMTMALADRFRRECDTVFTMLTPRILVDVPVDILPCAHDPHRLWMQRNHYAERQRMRELVRRVRDAA